MKTTEQVIRNLKNERDEIRIGQLALNSFIIDPDAEVSETQRGLQMIQSQIMGAYGAVLDQRIAELEAPHETD